MSTDDLSASRIPQTEFNVAKARDASARQQVVRQVASEQGLQSFIDEGAFSPIMMARRFETLESKRKRTAKEEETKKTEAKESRIAEIERVEEISDDFSRKNPELQGRSLLLLRARINPGDTKEQILSTVLAMYPDYSLADEALDFLLQTTEGDLAKEVLLAKEELNALHGREIKAGRNIAEQAREFSSQGLGSPTGLRDLYREITGNPRDSNTLFNELTSQFTYDKMKTVIDFLMHSMGGDLKSKGPSIAPGELHRLLSEMRKLQGFLGIFRFFKSRMNLIQSAFDRQGLPLPMRITFELLARLFMKAIQERYPSADKILQLGSQLGLSDEELAQIIIFTQMRDGVRQVAPRLFKSNQHRQDLLNAFMDAIEELDEEMDEEKEEEK